MSEETAFPEMWGEIIRMAPEVDDVDPGRLAAAMLLARWHAMSLDWTGRRNGRLHVTGIREWREALSRGLNRSITTADVKAWESGAVPVPTGVVRTALALADLDLDDLLRWDQTVIDWAAAVKLVVSCVPSYATSTALPQVMVTTRPTDRDAWRHVATSLASSVKQLQKVELLIRATLAEADRMRFLSQIEDDEPSADASK